MAHSKGHFYGEEFRAVPELLHEERSYRVLFEHVWFVFCKLTNCKSVDVYFGDLTWKI